MKLLSLIAGLLVIMALAACDSTTATPTPSGVTPPQSTPAESTPAASDMTPTTPANSSNPTDTPADNQSSGQTEPTPTNGATGLTTPVTEPVFVFMPRQGSPGAIVNITGDNFAPGTMVVIRIGTPDPVGEPLASVKVGEDGLWNTSITIPATLPSGETITTTNMQIVVMDESNKVLGTKPFKFSPAP